MLAECSCTTTFQRLDKMFWNFPFFSEATEKSKLSPCKIHKMKWDRNSDTIIKFLLQNNAVLILLDYLHILWDLRKANLREKFVSNSALILNCLCTYIKWCNERNIFHPNTYINRKNKINISSINYVQKLISMQSYLYQISDIISFPKPNLYFNVGSFILVFNFLTKCIISHYHLHIHFWKENKLLCIHTF